MFSVVPFRAVASLTAVLVVILLFLSFNIGRATAHIAPPAEGSADAGFARDMQQHHSQAVEMSMLIRDRSTDPEIRTMAYDIALTQQQQSGQMFAWLRDWGLPQTSRAEPMDWMHHGQEATAGHGTGHGTASPAAAATPATMPGMASAEDMDRLRSATGTDADTVFLSLMISHHKGGVIMAEAGANTATTDTVRTFARQLATTQSAEITAMEQMLAAK
jgi:uncharacterized protein (DUF305 family)